MIPILHHEYEVVVVAARPWGLDVEFTDGTPGQIVNAKYPQWPDTDPQTLIGHVYPAVVLDPDREPVRLSALDTDRTTARVLRTPPRS
ncbi:hypothetical protein [Streptomyces sp. NPDC048606]|uniref:hypothetical protein n=1 Tax=Streptomyces sp. NPDC048606 TaxID=3154726 RepID=UPI0034454D46